MTTIKRRVGWTALLVAAVLLAAWLLLYILSGVSEAIALNGPLLMGLRKEWLLEGSPENPSLGKYTAGWSDPARFFVWTNVYRINSNTVQSLFGVKDPKFEDKGILVVSQDGKLIWVDTTKPPKFIRLKTLSD